MPDVLLGRVGRAFLPVLAEPIRTESLFAGGSGRNARRTAWASRTGIPACLAEPIRTESLLAGVVRQECPTYCLGVGRAFLPDRHDSTRYAEHGNPSLLGTGTLNRPAYPVKPSNDYGHFVLALDGLCVRKDHGHALDVVVYIRQGPLVGLDGLHKAIRTKA